MIFDWINFALNVVGGATAFLCLFDGTRRICAYGTDLRAGLMVGLSLAFYVVYGTFAYLNYLDLTDTLSMQPHKSAPARTAVDPAKGPSPERKEAENVVRARQAFWESGRIEPYLDRLNEKKLFHPSQQDIRKRERLVANQAQLEYAARDSFAEALLWLVTGLLAALFGYGFSREKVPVPALPAAAGDASGGEPRPAA